MSLDDAQRARTAAEFRENLALAALEDHHFADDLGMDRREVDAIVAMEPGVDPARVWLLRDYLTNAIRARGLRPHPWATMTEQRRSAANGWFGLAEAPTPTL